LQCTVMDLQAAHNQIMELNQYLEMRVDQRTAALDAVNKELESFSYSVAHDLRAPLRHITGFADILRESAAVQLDEECKNYLDKIVVATKRMDQLIQDLLAFSRAARTELSPIEVDLDRVLEEALQAVRIDVRDRNIQWRCEHLPAVRGDPALLRQVFVNLLSNAIKYTRPRARAVIEVGHRGGRAHEVVIFVRDNGVGFDMRHAGQLFGVFRRLHAATEFEGTGIGLANAQRIVARHGGRIWAESAVDRGATFFFTLPSAESPQAASA
jgi:light-regulated signal transduction histidine kinase (bacteriophytochrome)